MHGTARGAEGLEFGRFRLSLRQRELRSGEELVPLGSRAFEVLLVLIEAAGELVTKEQLLARVWPGSVVEESNIQVQISALRKALGEDRNLILTVPLRGYRFTGEVRTVDASGRALESGEPRARAPARAASTNLPAAVSDFIGRESGLAEVRELLRGNRLVTLVGTGGIGKTRLGLEAARAALAEFPDGVWLAELAPLTDPELVASAINAALGLQSGAGRWTPERLAAALRSRELLLVLDNCEHVIAAAAREAEMLLHAAPGVRILATSQEPLGIEGECTYRLSPLEFPAEGTAEPEAALRHDAVRLFEARARAADPHFTLDERNAATVAMICRRLDGIPLAIELAAARAAALGIEGLAQRLDLRFHVLTGGRRTALPRHQTLRATLDWSHRLLSEPDRIVLRRLAVFAGSFSLEAAARVVKDPGLAEWEVVGRIAELVDKSLVVAEAGPVRRYRLLETTHAYAMEKLADSGEFGSLARLHASHVRDQLREALMVWESTPSLQWLETYAPEIDNVRVALDWAFGADGDQALGIELAAASHLLWYLLSLVQEGKARLERATAALNPQTAQKTEAQLWYGYGFLSTGEPRGRAVPALRRAVGLFRASGERVALGRALAFYGLNLARTAHLAEGLEALEEARTLLSAFEQPKSFALCLNNLAIARTVAGEYTEARSLLDQSLALGQHSRADFWVWRALIYKAEVEFAEGHVPEAIGQAREVVALCREARRTGLLGHALCNLAGYLIARGDLEEAGAALREGLPLAQESELDAVLVAGGMQHLAAIAARENRLERAAQLIGYAHAFFSSEFEGRSPAKMRIQERLLERLRGSMPGGQLTELMAAGARWTEDEAMSVALES